MILSVIILFLAVSLLLYTLLGGADFGIGILEATLPRSYREQMSKVSYYAIGPVWEANHMWVILAVVILFVGFPEVYSTISVVLHIPLSLLLLGIVLRGCAFVFRHYDAIKDGSEIWYARLFVFSSILTPLMMGICIAALIGGKVELESESFHTVYLAPWLAFFPLALGIFACLLCALQAAVFLLGDEMQESLRELIVIRAKYLLLLTILSGGIVFLAAEYEEIPLLSRFFASEAGFLCMFIASALATLLWWSIERGHPWLSRLLVSGISTSVLMGYFSMYFPDVILFSNGESLSLFEAAAPEATLRALFWALCIGSLLIFPALFYLFAVFKRVETSQ